LVGKGEFGGCPGVKQGKKKKVGLPAKNGAPADAAQIVKTKIARAETLVGWSEVKKKA